MSAGGTAVAPARRAPRAAFLKLFARNRLAAAGGVILIAVVLVAALAPLLPLQDPYAQDTAQKFLRPFSAGHLLGTDHLGRDILSRLIWGSVLSLIVGVVASVGAAFFGSVIGITAGYFGGRIDNWLMRAIDMLMAFPYILLALAIVAALGPGLTNALLAVAVVNIPFFARNIRGVTVSLAHKEFVDAARLAGMTDLRIMTSEILPNVLPLIVIAMSTTVGWMILETAGLSFLGLGSQPPVADLGSMLGEGRNALITDPHASIVPGLMIFIIVISVNLLGDGIRDALDPRLRSGALTRPMARTLVDREAAPEPPADPALLDVQDLRTEFRVGSRTLQALSGVTFRCTRANVSD
ncbi:ABC transporter permease [Marinobacterium aestuariivivens]|uniref:ABC transporter permease n=1 Tax=Marinobacterium aestuariivivens TaxID=1698799 RepID=A0ABW2A801_9GAMM